MPWVAGIGAAVLISLLSLVGIVLIPFQNEGFRSRFLSPMLSFAVGALLGDALLHLLPAAFGAHDHDEPAPADVRGAFVVFFRSCSGSSTAHRRALCV